MLSVRFNEKRAPSALLTKNGGLLWDERSGKILRQSQLRLVEYILRGARNKQITEGARVHPYTLANRLFKLFNGVGVTKRTELIGQVFARYPDLVEVGNDINLNAARYIYTSAFTAEERKVMRMLRDGLTIEEAREKSEWEGRGVELFRRAVYKKFADGGFDLENDINALATLLHLIKRVEGGQKIHRFDAQELKA